MLHRRTPDAITLDGLAPVGRTRPLAPAKCVIVQDCPVPEMVALVASDLSGRVRFRIELPREDAVDGWWIRLIRWALAVRHGSAEIQLLREG